MVWFDGDGYSPDTTHPDLEIARLAKLMEEMANLPRESEHVRQPGEKNSYEQYDVNGTKI